MKKEIELSEIPNELESEATAPKAKAPRVQAQKKLEEETRISDAVIPADQLLVEKGRNFISLLSSQSLVPSLIHPSQGDKDGMKEFNIQGVFVRVPVGKPVMVPESIAQLIRDIYGY